MNGQTVAAKRPRNAVATRAAIVDAAARLFANGGYDQAGVREIAAEAGIDPALVNRYFGSKEGLFVAVLESLVGPPRELGLPPGEFGLEIARRMLGVHGAGSRDQLQAIDIAIRSTNSPVAREVVCDDFERRFVRPMVERLGGGPGAEARALATHAVMMGTGVLRGLIGGRAAMRPHIEEMIAILAPILDQLADPERPPPSAETP